jgi:ABC-type oligopeptide transport system substrate-binding subunit
MRNVIIYSLLLFCICAASCKGKNSGTDGADSGQVHVNGATQEDSTKYQATPIETGGQDTSGNGVGTLNATKDSTK